MMDNKQNMIDLNLFRHWMIRLINSLFFFFVFSIFTDFQAEALNYSTIEVDNEIANALAGKSNTQDLRKAASQDRQSLVDQFAGQSPMIRNAYLASLDLFIEGKVKLGNIGIALSEADWKNLGTLKLAQKFRHEIDRLLIWRQFDPSALEQINSTFLAKIETVSQYREGNYLYLDVDESSIKEKPELLVYDKKSKNITVIENHDYVPPLPPPLQPAPTASAALDQRDDSSHTPEYGSPQGALPVPKNNTVEKIEGFIVKVYFTSQKTLDNQNFKVNIKNLCDKLRPIKDSTVFMIFPGKKSDKDFQKHYNELNQCPKFDSYFPETHGNAPPMEEKVELCKIVSGKGGAKELVTIKTYPPESDNKQLYKYISDILEDLEHSKYFETIESLIESLMKTKN